MKKKCIVTALALLTGYGARADEPITNSVAASQQYSLSSMNRSFDDMAGRFGAGFTLGEPLGGSFKYFFKDSLAIDGAVGWSLHDHSDVYLHSDVLWHNYRLLPVSQGRMPVYFGVGALARFRNHGLDNQVGVRAPLGVSYLFDNAPLDIFVEVGPALIFAPYVRGEVTGGIGVRFWF